MPTPEVVLPELPEPAYKGVVSSAMYAGAAYNVPSLSVRPMVSAMSLGPTYTADQLRAFAIQAVLDERDHCALWIGTALAEMEGIETDDDNNCLKAAISALHKALRTADALRNHKEG